MVLTLAGMDPAIFERRTKRSLGMSTSPAVKTLYENTWNFGTAISSFCRRGSHLVLQFAGGATESTQSSGHAVIDIKPQVHVRFMNSMLEEGAGKKEL